MKNTFILVILFSIIFSGVTLVHATQSHPEAYKVLPAKIALPTPNMVDLINMAREQDGEAKVSENMELDTSAKAKACDMRDRHYFEHNDPQGKTTWHFFTDAGYTYSYAGENLAIGYHTMSSAMYALLLSPEHRENILDPHFTEVGIGVCGEYIVQHFGTEYVQ